MAATAPQPTRYGTCWHLPARKPTKPRNRQQLRERMRGWRHGPEGPWGAACGSVDEWVAVQRCRDAYAWLRAQLPTA